MPRANVKQCPRCGRTNDRRNTQCDQCGTPLVKQRFSMTKERIKRVHALAVKKGLIERDGDKDMYYLVLNDLGVKSSLDMKEKHYNQYLQHVEKLPDVA